MAVITGTDELSLEILKSLGAGMKVKDIPRVFNVSLDQAKRLSRYSNMLEQSKEHLSKTAFMKVRTIGLKVLVLAPLFKAKDWEGLNEILSSIDVKVKRDELSLLIEALYEKRKRIQDFQKNVNLKLEQLDHREKKLQELEVELNRLIQKAREATKFLSKYPQNVQDFLIKHLGIYGDKLVLSRRLDSQWQRALKKKGVLNYTEYVWFINDLDALVEEYERRIKRKFAIEWDYQKEKKRSKGRYDVPQTPEYKLPAGLAADLLSSVKEINEKIQSIITEREAIQEEVKQLRKTSPQSFIEQVEAANTLSVRDLKRHGELQYKALKWLYDKGYVVASEVILPNGKRADVIGYDETGRIVIIEVKVSATDFKQDDKWESYLEYCDDFYFLLAKEVQYAFYEQPYKNIGLLEEMKNTLRIKEEHTLQHTANEREEVQFLITRTLSKKFIYGY